MSALPLAGLTSIYTKQLQKKEYAAKLMLYSFARGFSERLLRFARNDER